MTVIRIPDTQVLNKWLHQNGFSWDDDISDYIEGNLLDNMLIPLRRGVAAIYEKALNCWTSCYIIHFASYKNETEVNKVEADWYEFREEVEA